MYLYDWQKHQVKNYTILQSLPSNTVYALVKTPIGKVRMSTDKGLAFIDHGKVTTEQNGLFIVGNGYTVKKITIE